ncbi:MAG TPA: hypothetical protein V6C72_14585, partial [Chroococcales cyanobacterium]
MTTVNRAPFVLTGFRMSLTLILLASALSINATALVPAQAAQKGEHVISGKVTGQARKPVEGASV